MVARLTAAAKLRLNKQIGTPLSESADAKNIRQYRARLREIQVYRGKQLRVDSMSEMIYLVSNGTLGQTPGLAAR